MYNFIAQIKEKLERKGHIITLPNSYEEPMKEEEMKKIGKIEHEEWKSNMIILQTEKIKQNDAILVLNYEKNNQSNYIGGATFLEIFKAFELNKKVFLMNPIPENMLKDEIIGMKPIILNGDLDKIK
jgi:uncharacterized protein YrzB (UPF0473 family)